VLWLGLTGFSSEERARLTTVAERFKGHVRWGLSAFPDADAWLVNGEKVQPVDGGTIRVSPGIPTERMLRLHLRDVNRPIAFAVPVPEGFDPLCRFDLRQERTVSQTLAQLAAWLKPRQAQFTLGREIVRRGAALRHGVFHVSRGDRLLATLNFRNGKVGYARDMAPESLRDALWLKRPPAAADVPPQFIATTAAQLSWTFVRHSEQELLPVRYRTGPVYFRGAPKVPLHWLSDSQLMLLRELNTESGSIPELRQRTGLPLAQIERDLACLYFAAAVTSTRSKAARTLPTKDSEAPSSGPDVADLMRTTESPPAELDPGSVPGGLTRQYTTVPAPLMARA
jgi:hypothetical protein